MEIPQGVAGIKETLKLMRQLVRTGKVSLPVRTLAVQLTEGISQKDWASEVRALHQFVRDDIRYVKDINDVETLHSPDKILEFKAGDCDDKSILLASLLESIGHPTRFVAISQSPGEFCHVYVETKIRNNWIPLEATEPWDGGKAPKAYEKLVIHN